MGIVLNKRVAYGLRSIKTIGICCILLCCKSYGQDTVLLKDVEVTATKEELAQIGKKKQHIDSTIKEQFRFGSLGDVLTYNSPVYIKGYGPGGISTTAFRGGSAEQTAILWNGFNIQNYMLGQTDLSLLPAVLFETIGVEYGGSSSLWGSGAVGGTIHLDNKTSFNRGLLSAANIGGGSYGMRNVYFNVLYSKQRFISSTKVYVKSAENNFNYKDTLDKEEPMKRQKKSAYAMKGLMQEFKFILNPKQVCSVNLWINDNFRQIPSFNSAQESKTTQYDRAIRLTGDWTYIKQLFKSSIRAGYFDESLDYNDSIAEIYSKSLIKTLSAENENYWNWSSNHRLNFGLSFLSSSAFSDNYEGRKNINRISLLVGNKFSFLRNRLSTYVSARLEYFSAGALPLTGGASMEYKLTRQISALANVARVYRQPTLNELYWMPGGNGNLKPEEGFTYEGTLNYKKTIEFISVSISASAYSRHIDNWISWIPGGGGNPTAVNIQKVWSRGGETSWKLQYRKNKWRIGIQANSAYVLSTTEATILENSDDKGKQLVYTPRYNLNGNLSIGFKGVELIYFHQYVGYRYTTGDNSQWLSPYHLSSLKANYKWVLKKLNLVFFASVNNLGNSNYRIMAGRPMPLRNYEFGLTLQTK